MELQKIIEKGLALGLEEVEVYANQSESNTLKLNDGALEAYDVKSLFGVSIRALYQGKMGYVYTETLEEEDVDGILQQLLQNIQVLDATEPEFMYGAGATYQPVPELVSDYPK